MSPKTAELKKQDIIEQLTWDSRVDANQIFVKVEGGTVYLSGKVADYTAKMAAEKDAMKVAGVMNVSNEIEVEMDVDIMPSDEETSASIRQMLDLDRRLLSSEIEIEVSKGIVTLAGKVNSFWEKSLAEDIANTANGVIKVANRLVVRREISPMDGDIEDDIKNALQRNILVDESKVVVSVSNGKVRLSGNVANYPIKAEIYDIAMYTTGVVEVVDELTIG